MGITKTILLVDDEPDFLDGLSLTLEMAGYETLMAKNGSEAFSIVQNQPVDLIISDINMPLMGGYQLCKLVRRSPQAAQVPFLFLTGCRFLSDDEITYGKNLGVDEYFAKPIRSEKLLLAVQQMLSIA